MGTLPIPRAFLLTAVSKKAAQFPLFVKYNLKLLKKTVARISASHSSSYLSDIGWLGQTRLLKSGFQVDAGLLGEDVAYVAGEGEVNGGTAGQSSDFLSKTADDGPVPA